MISYWTILTLLSIIELALAAVFFGTTARIGFKPVGTRLMIIGIVFLVQSIVSLIVFNDWRNSGYGPSISKPLIIYHLLTITGLTVLVDITRK